MNSEIAHLNSEATYNLPIKIGDYKAVSATHRKKINSLLEQANISNPQIASKLTDSEFVSAIGQFCHSANIVDRNSIRVEIKTNNNDLLVYEGTKNDFVAVSMYFKKLVKYQGKNPRPNEVK